MSYIHHTLRQLEILLGVSTILGVLIIGNIVISRDYLDMVPWAHLDLLVHLETLNIENISLLDFGHELEAWGISITTTGRT